MNPTSDLIDELPIGETADLAPEAIPLPPATGRQRVAAATSDMRVGAIV